MKNNIPVFFSVDDNYVPFLIVTLESIITNASKNNHYDFYVLHNGISDANINRVLQYNSDNVNIQFVDMAEKLVKIGDALHTRDYYSKTTYYRLFIPTMFPHLDKALYLDCDIAVQADIADLYNTELGTNLVGAVPDEAVNTVPEFINYADKFLGVYHNNYFNAGILLMNLKELREFDFENKFINLILSYTFNVAQDQDYLNVICKDRVTYISKTWNKMPFMDNTLTVDDLNLIHYNLSFKPWHYTDVLYQEVFWKYAKASNMEEKMLQLLADFTEDKKQKDALGGKRLMEMAQQQSEMGNDTFIALFESGEIDNVTYKRRDALSPDEILSNIATKVKSDVAKKYNKN